MNITIRPAREYEWEDAMSLAWRTFQKFEAFEYSKEGNDSFLNFISDEGLYKMFLQKNYRVFVCLDEGRIVGMISLRKRNHISLLFVDENYQHKGIGRHLIEFVAMYVSDVEKLAYLTVDAAPYAKGFYERIHFEETGQLSESKGITYYPMALEIIRLIT